MPKKIRVYELAKELGLTNKEGLELALSLGIGVKSHSSSIEDAQADRVRRKADAEGLRRPVQPEEPAPAKKAAKATKAAKSSAPSRGADGSGGGEAPAKRPLTSVSSSAAASSAPVKKAPARPASAPAAAAPAGTAAGGSGDRPPPRSRRPAHPA